MHGTISSRLASSWALSLFAGSLLALPSVAMMGCGGSSKKATTADASDGGPGGDTAPPGETSSGETSADGSSDETTAADAAPDVPVTPPTCTAAPAFALPVRVSHNPDGLRTVSDGAMAVLPNSTLLIAFVEALDDTGRAGLFARTFDPAVGTPSDDVRLDADADNLSITTNPSLSVEDVGNGVKYLSYVDSSGTYHFRVYSQGKWSPDLATDGGLPWVAGDGGTIVGGADGTALAVRTQSTAPYVSASLYQPNVGGTQGSWSAITTLDLAGATTIATVQVKALSDGSYVLLSWQGDGGPAVQVRTPSGAWSTASFKAEVGDLGAPVVVRVLDDATVVLVSLEASNDNWRALETHWTASAGWTTASLLSKTPSADGVVVPATSGMPYLFQIAPTEVELVAWTGACTTASTACNYAAIQRRFTSDKSGGTWTDPADLGVGPVSTGPAGLDVTSTDGVSAIVTRASTDGTSVQARVRFEDEDFAALVQILDPTSTNFLAPIATTVSFFGRRESFWAIAGRTQPNATTGALMTMPSLVGKLSLSATPITTWISVSDASGAYLQTSAPLDAYADGSGGFGIADGNATDGVSVYPIVGQVPPTAGTINVQSVLLADESSASFTDYPHGTPRPTLDLGGLVLVTAVPTGTTTPGNRLRAYSWNGIGAVSAKLLANESRLPRAFATSGLTFGCGGAVLYAEDPADGTHALQLVLAQ